MKLWWRNILCVVAVLLFGAVLSRASECRIERVEWVGDHSEFDELSMNVIVGAPCDSWRAARQKLLRYYEDRGFVGASLDVRVDSAGVAHCEFVRGSAWVWAEPENLDSNATDIEVFRMLTGLEIGVEVSLSDLERSERRLARLGYYENPRSGAQPHYSGVFHAGGSDFCGRRFPHVFER